MKRIISFFLCILLCFCLIKTPACALGVSAKYACLMDATTGRVLFEKNAYEKHSMASTTKIMTALVALENGNLDDIVTVSSTAAGTEGSSIYLKSGEKISLRDLLFGLMLASGNDAAVAIAEHISGDVASFAKLMTAKALSIGAKNTAFKNANGLDEDGHFTTAYDLALITRYALSNEAFLEIVSTKTKNISNGNESYMRSLTNHNKLLNNYPGCIGVKTGYTKKTGRCLVSAAERDNLRLIAVTLNAPDDWTDHTNMLNFGFNSYSAKPLIIKDMVLKTVPVKNGNVESLELVATESFFISLDKSSGLSDISFDYQIPSKIEAPIKKGSPCGKLSIYYNEKKIKEISLVSAIDVTYNEPEKITFFVKLKNFILRLFNLF